MKIFDKIPQKVFHGIATFIGTFVVALILLLLLHWARSKYQDWKTSQYSYNIIREESVLNYQEKKSQLVRAANSYIDSVAPTSNLTGYAIVENCEKYDLDIIFVLSHAQIESNFGTRGMAAKTNSVFNVGAIDNMPYEKISDRYKYSHPDHSIEPYMRLLYANYITNGKTELDLIGRFVDKKGKRYASDEDYERKLLDLYKQIKQSTDLSLLQGEMHRYKIISGM